MSTRGHIDVQLRVELVPMTPEQEASWELMMDMLAEQLVEHILAKRKEQEDADGQAEPAQHIPA